MASRFFLQGERITKDTENHARNRLNEFNKQDVIKLLCFIDEEVGIARGSIGQSVEAIISTHSNRDQILLEIIEDCELSMPLREVAALIYAYNNKQAALPSLIYLSEQGSWYAGELHTHLKEYGCVDPYA